MTAATRLFDVLALLADDNRVRIVFTRTGSSAFDHGTTEFLAARGVRVLPWREAVRTEFDLAISASYGGDLHKIRAPLVVVPHGAGYNKYLNKEQRTKNKEQRTKNKEQRTKNKEQSVFGLSPDWLVHKGEIIPDIIVLSHPEQRQRLQQVCPQAVPNTLVAGDICLDRLRAGRALRASYRRTFGLAPGQHLIVVSSTWGPDSLLAQIPDLPLRLAESLPIDEFRILVAKHPNISAGHSSWQADAYLSEAKSAGVCVPDDVDAWLAAVVASSLVVGDHGSVSLYSVAVGNPLILATAPTHTVHPASPIAQLLSAAPRLDFTSGLEGQVRRSIDEHSPKHYGPITALASSAPDTGAATLRSAMYRAMQLPEPTTPAELRPPLLSRQRLHEPESQLVSVDLGRDRTATVMRYPAGRMSGGRGPEREAHLVVGLDSPCLSRLRLADVVLGPGGTDTEHWIAETLLDLPGCAIAAAPDHESGRWLLGDTTGALVELTGSDIGCRLFASVAYQLTAHDKDLGTACGAWTVTGGGRAYPVTMSSVGA